MENRFVSCDHFTRNQAGRIIRMIRKGFTQFTLAILIQTKLLRSHAHHRQLRIFAANSPGLTNQQTNESV
ncbi:MAG: hypothetical protein O9353_15880 [Bacteroidia bacterium]|nr:hypothetical protein [Bacteroidia bacterium]